MRIVFVRHGHPNYEDDCLTPLGRQHAQAAAKRLADEGISRIFSSTCGRALETASYTAKLLSLPVEERDFMREISWGGKDGIDLPLNGHPWDTADRMILDGQPLMAQDWREKPPFQNNTVIDWVNNAAVGTDQWLSELGYVRTGDYYRAGKDTCRTVAAFGHGGASTAILSHLLNIPFPFVCCAMGPNYTGITIVTLADAPGELVMPRLELMNDARHIKGLEIDNLYNR